MLPNFCMMASFSSPRKVVADVVIMLWWPFVRRWPGFLIKIVMAMGVRESGAKDFAALLASRVLRWCVGYPGG